MSRYIGPKNKLARRIGEDLSLKSNSVKVSRRLGIRPGQHGAKGKRKLSDFGTQLAEKQKLKYIYGITEKQLRRLYLEASASSVATGEGLLSSLERRLDNVVYRAGWAITRAGARQLVAHGHVLVNSKKVTIPSYQVQVEDVVNLSGKIIKNPDLSERIKDSVASVEWIEKKQAVAKIARLPKRSDIRETVTEQLVVEYYSR
jgi:small subunit ribosomal protein S4